MGIYVQSVKSLIRLCAIYLGSQSSPPSLAAPPLGHFPESKPASTSAKSFSPRRQVAQPSSSGITLGKVIEREREGDYCVPCVSNKHLMRAKDALTDALNIVSSEGKFTQVAEDKIGRAIYNLNGAEEDVALAKVPPAIKLAVDEMGRQIRKLRNFLRADQSGLEVATLAIDIPPMKKDLEAADRKSVV